MSGELGPHIPHEIQAGEISGWRGWHLVSSYEKLRLLSPDMQTVWMPDQEIEAFCKHDYTARLTCMCGINAYRTREQLEKSSRIQHTVIGEIAMHGDVQEYEKGYRSEYASIKALYVKARDLTSQVISELARTYNVPVYVYEVINGKMVYHDDEWSDQFASFARSLSACQDICEEFSYLVKTDPLTPKIMALYLWAACTIQENKNIAFLWLSRFDAPTTMEAIENILNYAQIDEADKIWSEYQHLSYEDQKQLSLDIQKLLEAKLLLQSA